MTPPPVRRCRGRRAADRVPLFAIHGLTLHSLLIAPIPSLTFLPRRFHGTVPLVRVEAFDIGTALLFPIESVLSANVNNLADIVGYAARRNNNKKSSSLLSEQRRSLYPGRPLPALDLLQFIPSKNPPVWILLYTRDMASNCFPSSEEISSGPKVFFTPNWPRMSE